MDFFFLLNLCSYPYQFIGVYIYIFFFLLIPCCQLYGSQISFLRLQIAFFSLYILCLIEIFIDVIVALYAIIKNNTEKSYVHFTPFCTMVIFCKTIVYRKQDIESDTIHSSYSIFFSVTYTCVYTTLYNFITRVNSYIHQQSQNTEQCHH